MHCIEFEMLDCNSSLFLYKLSVLDEMHHQLERHNTWALQLLRYVHYDNDELGFLFFGRTGVFSSSLDVLASSYANWLLFSMECFASGSR